MRSVSYTVFCVWCFVYGLSFTVFRYQCLCFINGVYCTVLRIWCFMYSVSCTVLHHYMNGVCVSCFVHTSSVPCTMIRVWFLYGGSCTVFCVQHFVYRVPCIRYRLPCTVNKVLNLSLQVSASLERYSFSNILACIGINTSHLYITLQYNLFNLRNDRGWLPK